MLQVGRDRRPVMRAAQAMFAGEPSGEEALAAFIGGPAGEDFYAKLYIGLFKEAEGEEATARCLISSAARGAYRSSGDPMVDVARVHLKRRGWESAPLCDEKTYSPLRMSFKP